MSVRDTSKEAYASIAGELSERQATVLSLLQQSHPVTNNEIAARLDWEINTVTPRVHELRERGLVKSFGKRKCSVTGRTAYQWGIGREAPEPAPQRREPVIEMRDGVRVAVFR